MLSRPASEDTFYDIHMHAFNLSHPNFYSFLARYNLLPESILDAGLKIVVPVAGGIFLVAGIILALIFGLFYLAVGLPFWVSAVVSILATVLLVVVVLVVLRYSTSIREKIDKTIRRLRANFNNMLSIFENDIGSYFLIIENCLRETDREWQPLLQGDTITIGKNQQKNTYKRVVMTPLMMDFGQKSKERDRSFHYNELASKPVNEQVIDVFNAIRWYKEATYSRYQDRLTNAYRFLKDDTQRFFEIYPFMAINTSNYQLKEIDPMLNKYFSEYRRSRAALAEKLGTFDGDVRAMRSNFFAGIKVYPPLGFNPWPGQGEEQQKVEKLYSYCEEHGIPMTSHGGSSGFVAITDRNELLEVTSMKKWRAVVGKYRKLRLNIAHFPAEVVAPGASRKSNYKLERERFDALDDLIVTSEDVYTDFSCRAVKDEYYQWLKIVLETAGDKRQKLTERILFGSDFAVVLGSIDSYSRYVNIFSQTEHLTDEEKHYFCCINPQRFLFG